MNNIKDIQLPEDINELTYLYTYRSSKNSIELSCLFYKYDFLLLKFEDNYYNFVLYKIENELSVKTIKTFLYENYKYTTDEINNFILKQQYNINDNDIALKTIFNKYKSLIRKDKINNILNDIS